VADEAETTGVPYRRCDPRSAHRKLLSRCDKTHISNWRWLGRPSIAPGKRNGRALVRDYSRVQGNAAHIDFHRRCGRHRNVLSIRLQPNEGITSGVTIKNGPGAACVFRCGCAFGYDICPTALALMGRNRSTPMNV